jgi:hypothetical protein
VTLSSAIRLRMRRERRKFNRLIKKRQLTSLKNHYSFRISQRVVVAKIRTLGSRRMRINDE